ncbi:MAG: 30S ribosomal protein S9 [Spirochaetota bacterium]
MDTNANLALGTGRRKTSIARVYLREGNGQIKINDRTPEDYFGNPSFVFVMKQPMDVTDSLTKYDLVITVRGGGPSGQAGACRHGIARALAHLDETNIKTLRANGFLTRDPRMVERKKYGQRGARSKFQFSKR